MWNELRCVAIDKLRHRFGRVAVIVDNAAYRDLGRVQRYLEENDDFVKLIFLPPYLPFLNPAEWLRRNGNAILSRTFRRPAKSYFRLKVMLIYESLEINFNPRDILFKNLDKLYPA